MRKLMRKQEETQGAELQDKLREFSNQLERLGDEIERVLRLFSDIPSKVSSRQGKLVEKIRDLSRRIEQADPEKVDEQFLSQIQGELDQIEMELNNLENELVPLVEEGQVVIQQGYQPSASTVNQILRPAFDELRETERQVTNLMEMARRGRKVTTPSFTTVVPPGGFEFPFPLSETIMPTKEEEEVALQYWVIVIEGHDVGTPEYEASMQSWRNELATVKNEALSELNEMWTQFYETLREEMLRFVPGMSKMTENVRTLGFALDPSLTMAVDEGYRLHIGLEFFLTHLGPEYIKDLVNLKTEYKEFIEEAMRVRENNPKVENPEEFSKQLRNLSPIFKDGPYPIIFWRKVAEIANKIEKVPHDVWLRGEAENLVRSFHLASVISMHELLHLIFGHTTFEFQRLMDVIRNDPEYIAIIKEAYERNRPRLMREFAYLWTPYLRKHKEARKWFADLIQKEKGITVSEDDVDELIKHGMDIVVPPFEKLPEEFMKAFFNGLSNIIFDLMVNAVWETWKEDDRRPLPNFSEFDKFYTEMRNFVKELLSEHDFFIRVLRQVKGGSPLTKMLANVLFKEAEGKKGGAFYDAKDYGLDYDEVMNIWKVLRTRRDAVKRIIEDGARKFFDNIHVPPPTGEGGKGGIPLFKLPPLWGDNPAKKSDDGEVMRPEEQRRIREETVRQITGGEKRAGKGAGDYRDMIETAYMLSMPGIKIENLVEDLAVQMLHHFPETGEVAAPHVIETELYRRGIEPLGGKAGVYHDVSEDETLTTGRVIPFIFIVDTSGSVDKEHLGAALYGIRNAIEVIKEVNKIGEEKGTLFHVYVVPADVQVDEIIDLGVFGGGIPISKVEEVIKGFIMKEGKVAGGGGTDMLRALQEVVGLLKRAIKENKENPLSTMLEDKIKEPAPNQVTFVTVEPKSGVGPVSSAEDVEVKRYRGEEGIKELNERWKNYVGAVVIIITDGYYDPPITVDDLKKLEEGDLKVIVRVVSYERLDPELARAGYAVKGEVVRRREERRYLLRKGIDPELLKVAVWSRVLRKLRNEYLR